MSVPTHALRERSGSEYVARCGFSTKGGRSGSYTVWERMVSCCECIALRGPNQTPPRQPQVAPESVHAAGVGVGATQAGETQQGSSESAAARARAVFAAVADNPTDRLD